MSLLGRLFGSGKARKPAEKSDTDKGAGNAAGKSAKAKTAKPAKANAPAKKSAAAKGKGKK
jgi:hypothetical protein